MSIADFADDLLGNKGFDLTRAGKNCQLIAEVIKDKNSAMSLIATSFWQTFMRSSAFLRTLKDTGISSRGINNGQRFIIRHGNTVRPRHDLVVFDPGFRSNEPFVVPVIYAPLDEFREGWESFLKNINLSLPKSTFRAMIDYGQRAVEEALMTQSFGLIVTTPLEQTLTSALPSPAIGAAHKNKVEPPICTIGVIAKSSGREGVTTALHALNPKYSSAYVGGLMGTIDPRDKNNVTDSCFIQVPGIFARYSSSYHLLAGPLKGKVPGINQPVSFERCNSGRILTKVLGWDPDIPFLVTPNKRLLVLTNPVTIPTDSGTALVDPSDQVIGFAFLTTGADSGFSGWIWAETVFDAHSLM